MPGEVEVRGTHELAALARQLKEAGNGELRRELLAGIRAAGKPVLEKSKHRAGSDLPKAGGLAAQVAASKFSVRTSLALSGATVKLMVTNNKGLIASTDSGSIRHPVFGGDTWVQQDVRGGWFSQTAADSAETFRIAIYAAMDRVASKVMRAV